MSVLGTVTVSTLYECQTPDGRIVTAIYTRLATPEERQRIIDGERGGLSESQWFAKRAAERERSP